MDSVNFGSRKKQTQIITSTLARFLMKYVHVK